MAVDTVGLKILGDIGGDFMAIAGDHVSLSAIFLGRLLFPSVSSEACCLERLRLFEMIALMEGKHPATIATNASISEVMTMGLFCDGGVPLVSLIKL